MCIYENCYPPWNQTSDFFGPALARNLALHRSTCTNVANQEKGKLQYSGTINLPDTQNKQANLCHLPMKQFAAENGPAEISKFRNLRGNPCARRQCVTRLIAVQLHGNLEHFSCSTQNGDVSLHEPNVSRVLLGHQGQNGFNIGQLFSPEVSE